MCPCNELKIFNNFSIKILGINKFIKLKEYNDDTKIAKFNALNLVKLENGYFAFLPNHKLKMNEERSFKKYSKIRNTFKV